MRDFPAHPAATNPARPWCLGDDLYRVDVTIRDRWECPSHLVGCIPHSIAHVPRARRFQAVALLTWPTHQHRREDGTTYESPASFRNRWVYGETMEEARWRLAQRREQEGWAHHPPGDRRPVIMNIHDAQELIEREGEPPLCPCGKGYVEHAVHVGDIVDASAIVNAIHGREYPEPRPVYVTIDGEDIYPALAAVDARTGDLQRWNGFVAFPMFDLSTTRRMVEDFTRDLDPKYVEADRYVWEGDVLLRFRWDGEPSHHPQNDEYHYVRDVIRPSTVFTDEPTYSIGAYEFTWSLATADDLTRAGIDPGLREL